MDKEKIKEGLNKAVKVLDVENDIEQILPGPSEQERNESRLRNAITGEPRPVEHINHEAKAFAHANATLPLLIGFLRGARLGSKALKGASAIDKVQKAVPGGLQAKMRPAQKKAAKAVEETGKTLKEAKKNAPKKLFLRFWETVNGANHDEIMAHRIAKENAKNVDTAIKVLSKNPPGKPGDVIEETAGKAAEKMAGGTVIATRTGKAVADNVGKKKKYDGKLELSGLEKAMNTINGIAGEPLWNPDKWPMEQIDQLLLMTNGDADIWDEDSLDELSDEAKVKLIVDTMHGKYNDYGDVSGTMLKNYLKMTNKDEVHE